MKLGEELATYQRPTSIEEAEVRIQMAIKWLDDLIEPAPGRWDKQKVSITASLLKASLTGGMTIGPETRAQLKEYFK